MVLHSPHRSQRYGKFPRGVRFKLTSGLTSCTGEMAPKQLAFKTNRESPIKNYRTVGKGKPILKGPVCRLTRPRNQHKNTRQKAQRQQVKETPINLGASAGEGTAGSSQGTETPAPAVFAVSLCHADVPSRLLMSGGAHC